jgi:hypothetical protein
MEDVLPQVKALDRSFGLRYHEDMNTTLERIRNEAKALSTEDRELLLVALDYDLHGDVVTEAAEVEAAWDAEIEKRVAEIKSGQAKLLTSEEFFSVFAEARASLNQSPTRA